MGSRTRGNSGVKVPHMMVLSEGFFLGVLSRRGVMVHPSQAQREGAHTRSSECLPRRLPQNWQTPLQTQIDKWTEMECFPSSVPRGILRRCGWSGLLRLGHGGLECQGQERR